MSYSSITIVGNLGGDPEMRYLPNGTPVTNFSIAVNRDYNTADGQKETETMWLRIAAWGKLGEVCNQYLTKGRQVLVVGRLIPDKTTGGPRTFTRQDGGVGASFEVTAETVRFLGGSGDNRNGENRGDAHDHDNSPTAYKDDAIPF